MSMPLDGYHLCTTLMKPLERLSLLLSLERPLADGTRPHRQLLTLIGMVRDEMAQELAQHGL
jgi:hypothetical protein